MIRGVATGNAKRLFYNSEIENNYCFTLGIFLHDLIMHESLLYITMKK